MRSETEDGGASDRAATRGEYNGLTDAACPGLGRGMALRGSPASSAPASGLDYAVADLTQRAEVLALRPFALNLVDHKVSVEKVSQLELTLCEPQNFSKTLSLFYD